MECCKFAKAYLCNHPLCVLCQKRGLVIPARCVDHIDMQGPLGERGYDETNLRALCKTCHDSLDKDNKPRKGCDANGYPIEL
jgi:5-methylcytosine-specific restriction protein A